MGKDKATAIAPGSCGELVQGTREGENFLVSCPVNRYAKAVASLTRREGVRVFPPFFKTARAVEMLLERVGETRWGVEIEMESQIPKGAGMASSTADILAATAAVAALFGYSLSPEEAAQIACSVEPSDGLMFPQLTVFNHRKGKAYETLGPVPPLGFVVVQAGKPVDTLKFNARPDLPELNRRNEPRTAEALKWLATGILQQDWTAVGRATTESALANQSILPKPFLEEIKDMALECGGLGVNVAHSGSVVGILFDPQTVRGETLADRLQKKLPFFPSDWEIVYAVPGGAEVI